MTGKKASRRISGHFAFGMFLIEFFEISGALSFPRTQLDGLLISMIALILSLHSVSFRKTEHLSREDTMILYHFMKSYWADIRTELFRNFHPRKLQVWH